MCIECKTKLSSKNFWLGRRILNDSARRRRLFSFVKEDFATKIGANIRQRFRSDYSRRGQIREKASLAHTEEVSKVRSRQVYKLLCILFNKGPLKLDVLGIVEDCWVSAEIENILSLHKCCSNVDSITGCV